MKPRAHQLLWLSGILFVMVAALLPVLAQDSRPPQPPIIRAQYEGMLFDGVAGSACYPKPDNTPLCTFVDDPNPTGVIGAREDKTVTFVISPAQPAPQALSIAFIDAAPPNAEPPTRDLLATNGELTLENLSPNRQRVLITAVYPSDRGQGEFFVSYVFALQVLPRPTATPTFTSTPSPTATDTPTITPTFTPTFTSTPSATPTRRPSPTPTFDATLGAPTQAPETPVLPETPSLAETPQPSPTLLPEATATLLPVDSPTPLPTPSPTPTSTATLVPLTDLGYPNVQLLIGDVAFTPIALVGCLNLPSGQRCLSTPLEAPITRVVSAAGSIAQLEFVGAQPEAVVVNLFESDGVVLIGSQVLPLSPIPVYILPIEAGTYVLSVEVIWLEGNATYFFRLVVSGEN
ncbi:MAG: hypothetical protein SNJ58_11650 [Aggregatilineales bacterium]